MCIHVGALPNVDVLQLRSANFLSPKTWKKDPFWTSLVVSSIYLCQSSYGLDIARPKTLIAGTAAAINSSSPKIKVTSC